MALNVPTPIFFIVMIVMKRQIRACPNSTKLPCLGQTAENKKIKGFDAVFRYWIWPFDRDMDIF